MTIKYTPTIEKAIADFEAATGNTGMVRAIADAAYTKGKFDENDETNRRWCEEHELQYMGIECEPATFPNELSWASACASVPGQNEARVL